MTTQRILDFYRAPDAMTRLVRHGDAFDELPGDLPGLVRVVQGQLLHEHWASAYGQQLTDARRAGSHLRSTDEMLDAIFARDTRPVWNERGVSQRLVGVCRHFALLLVAMLRTRGLAARARCGFGAYFEAGQYVDHWVCEYWDDVQRRWVLVDSQIDALQTQAIKPTFDLLDVPRDRFVIAGDAWTQCRAGALDPQRCGIMHLRGLWFVAGNVLRDLASLNNMAMLPWDVWGPMPPADPIDVERIGLFDRLAELTRDPDAHFDALRAAYEQDGLRVPHMVFNAVLNREDDVQC